MPRLTPTQRLIRRWLFSDRRLMFLSGDVRSGKSLGLTLLPTVWGLGEREVEFAAFGRSLASLDASLGPHLKETARILGHSPNRRKSGAEYTISNVHWTLIGVPNEAALEGVWGRALDFAFVDEAVRLPDTTLPTIITRLDRDSSKLAVATNPGNPYHPVKTDYFDKARELGAVRAHARLDDNPGVSVMVREALRRELSATPHMRARALEGLWVLPDGLVYPWGLPELDLPAEPRAEVQAGVDFGTENPSCALFGYVEDGALMIFDEYWADGGGTMSAGEIAGAILERGNRHGCKRYHLDPSASPLEIEMRRLGADVRDAPNEVNEGIAEVQRKIAEGELAFRRGACPNAMREAAAYRWDKARSARLGRDVVVKENDHSLDSARYLVMGTRRSDWVKVSARFA